MTRRGYVHHLDGNPRNNDPANLAIVDRIGQPRTLPSLHRDLLRVVGVALYGESFHRPLALDLDVGVRVMERWATGRKDIPDGIWFDLVKICRERRLAIGKIEKQLRGL